MPRETITINRKKLLAALNAVERALVQGDVEQALRLLEVVYRLVPPPTQPPSEAGR